MYTVVQILEPSTVLLRHLQPYPSNRILEIMAQNDVQTLLSDDAHNVENIGHHFDAANQLIKQFNLKQIQR